MTKIIDFNLLTSFEIIALPYRLPKPWPQMHGASETLLEILARGAHPAAHPVAVAHDLEAVVPDLQQVILINIALSEGAVNVRAGGDVSVEQHGTDVDAGAAEEVAVANILFVFTCVCFAAECQVDFAFATRGGDKPQHLFHLRTAEHQLTVMRCPPDGGNGEQTPMPDSVGYEQLL